MSDSEFDDKSLVRTELTTIPANSPENRRLLNFTITTYRGFEVYTYRSEFDGMSPSEVFDDRHWPRSDDGTPLYHCLISVRDDLRPGDRVIWKAGPWDYVWGLGVIHPKEDGNLTVQTVNEQIVGLLEFDTDDRHCWVCTLSYNAAAIDRIQIPR